MTHPLLAPEEDGIGGERGQHVPESKFVLNESALSAFTITQVIFYSFCVSKCVIQPSTRNEEIYNQNIL